MAVAMIIALTTPTPHTSAATPMGGGNGPEVRASVQSSSQAEMQAAEAEWATARWTKMLAFATVFLGIVTVFVTLYDQWTRRVDRMADRRRHARSEWLKSVEGLAQMQQILYFFMRRCELLEENPAFRAEALRRGFGAAMTRALGDGMAQALTSQELAEQVYLAIFDASDVMAFAAAHQASSSGRNAAGDPTSSEAVRTKARAARMGAEQAMRLVRDERTRLRSNTNFTG